MARSREAEYRRLWSLRERQPCRHHDRPISPRRRAYSHAGPARDPIAVPVPKGHSIAEFHTTKATDEIESSVTGSLVTQGSGRP